MRYLKAEATVRDAFNKLKGANAEKKRLDVSSMGAKHEFDIYESGNIIAGVSTSPWKNSSGTNNTAGQDRAAAEIFWLSVWSGKEARYHILTDADMASKIFDRFKGVVFLNKVEIYHFNLETKVFTSKGVLGTKHNNSRPARQP